MSKKKSIFLNTELISKLPNFRDFIATPEFFPRAAVQPGAGLSHVPARGWMCQALAALGSMATQGKSSFFVQRAGGGPCPTEILGEGGFEWFPDLAPTLGTKGG